MNSLSLSPFPTHKSSRKVVAVLHIHAKQLCILYTYTNSTIMICTSSFLFLVLAILLTLHIRVHHYQRSGSWHQSHTLEWGIGSKIIKKSAIPLSVHHSYLLLWVQIGKFPSAFPVFPDRQVPWRRGNGGVAHEQGNCETFPPIQVWKTAITMM